MIKKILIAPTFVALSLLCIIIFYFFLPAYNFIPFPFNLSGLIIVYLGFVVMGKSRELFKKNAVSLDITEPAILIREGVFLKSRNPMYAGMFLLLLGTAICFRNIFSILSAFAFVIMVQIFVIPREEKLMLKAFGDEYLAYKRKIRRWL
ncbi:MAG: methyltransferase family protein [Bacteroidota bacterium]